MKEAGRTTVHFSVPYTLKGFDGWVVTSSKQHPRPQVLLTTELRYGAVRSFATNAACVTGMCSAKNCSTASA